MTRVLVVEDSLAQAGMCRRLLERSGYQVELAPNGPDALRLLQHGGIDVVLTDLVLPGIDGLTLLERIRADYPKVPAILMTGQGNEDIAVEALQKGACSYLPKRRLETDLLRTLTHILGLQHADRAPQLLARCWTTCDQEFQLETAPELIAPLVGLVQDQLALLRFGDTTEQMRICVALTETLDNAIHHGNLELQSIWRQGDGAEWSRVCQQRLHQPPYCQRKVYVRTRLSRSLAELTIRDDGPGFDPAKLPDPRDPSRLTAVSGRGVFLARTFMDEVRYSPRGNEVVLRKRRTIPGE